MRGLPDLSARLFGARASNKPGCCNRLATVFLFLMWNRCFDSRAFAASRARHGVAAGELRGKVRRRVLLTWFRSATRLRRWQFVARDQMQVPFIEPVSFQANFSGGIEAMLSRLGCAVVVCLALASSAEATGRHGLVQRASCSVVRFYVAKFSASAAEMWARSHGATEADIEAARRCLKSAPAQTVQAAHWTTQ